MSEHKNSITIREGQIDINYRLFHDTKRKEEDGIITSFIPAFNMSLTSTSLEESHRLSKVLLRAFCDYHIKDRGIDKFFLEINSLGFKSDSHQELMRKAVVAKENIRRAKLESVSQGIEGTIEESLEESIAA